MNELISVVVPIYKVEKYLDRCLQSIVRQTYNNLEIILVDDGSPDSCPEMCDNWEKMDRRIKVVHKENGGLSSARNAGLDIASGDYIAFVDSDDYVAENMMEVMLDAVKRNGVSLACCGRVRVSTMSSTEMFVYPEERILSGEEAIKQLLTGGIVEEAAWDKLYSADIFAGRRFPVGEINEDIVQTIEILGLCEEIVHVGKALYYYCENQNSITMSKYTPNKKVCLKHLDQIEEYLGREYPQLLKYYSALELRYCQGLLYLLLDNAKTFNDNRSDYKEVFTRFRIQFKNTNFGQGMILSERVKGLMIYFNIYFTLHRLKRRYL